MDNEELQYIYPYPEEARENAESLFFGAEPQTKVYRIGMMCVALTAISLASYMFLFNVWCIIAAAVFALGGIKYMREHVGREHLIEIAAYKTHIELSYFSEAANTIEWISVPYAAIRSCKLSTDKYNCATLKYSKKHSGIEVKAQKLYDGSEIKAKKNGRFFFRLNEYTPEQEFFLYYADKLFHTKNDRKAIIARYGTANIYHEKYIEAEEEL